jgi:hypothetical protein
MARFSSEIAIILRATASQLEQSADYQWGHMGSCNCGFLGRQVTRLDKAEIHRRALQRYGDWNDQLIDYCPASGLPFDEVVSALLSAGFDIDDLKHLERLSDPVVLRELPKGTNLKHNNKHDVVLYLTTWARVVENRVGTEIKVPGSLFETRYSAALV